MTGLLMILWGAAGAIPLNPIGTPQPEGTASLAPTAYVGPDGWFLPQLYGAVGVRNADFNVGFMGDFHPGEPGVPILDVFPRWFVTEELALVPRVLAPIGAGAHPSAGFELHHVYNQGPFWLTSNVGGSFRVGGDKRDGFAMLMVAPELFVNDRVSVFMEFNPTVWFEGVNLHDKNLTMLVVPGVAANLDERCFHQISIGLQVPVAPTVGLPSLGGWYTWTVPFRKQA